MVNSVVLVTGAFGVIGSELVAELARRGRPVIVTGRDTEPNRRKAARLPAGVAVHWADLSRPTDADLLLPTLCPSVVVHLAAVIPPLCYVRRAVARAVNVDLTARLVRSAESMRTPPRLVFTSSLAVYGPRNPHRYRNDILAEDTAVSPSELYGCNKAEAEEIVRSSKLEWLILRLGGALSPKPQISTDLDALHFASAVPTDNRVHTVDLRDAAAALIAAATADVCEEVLLIGGDNSHRMLWGDIAPTIADALGLTGGFAPLGRIGNPRNDNDWYTADWMDTARAEQVLSFQRHSLSDTLAAVRAHAGRRRQILRLVAPLARGHLKRNNIYRNRPGIYSDPWTVIAELWGDTRPANTAR